MELGRRSLPPFRDYYSASYFRMHRWLLTALAVQCEYQVPFWDSYHYATLADQFDEDKIERIVNEEKARASTWYPERQNTDATEEGHEEGQNETTVE